MNRRPRVLRARWSAKEDDWLFGFPRKCDGALLHGAWIGYTTWPNFLADLKERGYDITTAKFEVTLLPSGVEHDPEAR